jgi:hypothetical protein
MIGKKLYHEKYGEIAVNKKKYEPLGNKVIFVAVDKKGQERPLDGTEIPLEKYNEQLEEEAEKEKESEFLIEEQKKKEVEIKAEKEKEQAEKQAYKEEKFKMHKEVLHKVENASKAIVGAVGAIPETVIPEIVIPDHYDDQKIWQDNVLRELKKEIHIPEVDFTSIEKAIRNIKFPEFPEQNDYTKLLQDIKKALPKDTDLSGVIKAIENIPKAPIVPFEFNKGRLKVEVDRIALGGGGGGTLTETESESLQGVATEETLQEVKTAINGIIGAWEATSISIVTDGAIRIITETDGEITRTTEIDSTDPNDKQITTVWS